MERKIRVRANNACEYCLMPQSAFILTFPIDHIIVRQHGGKTRADNLALACLRCNLHKGPNIAGIDPVSKHVVPLYYPRRDRWGDHFRWRGPRLVGLTPVARTTIRVLDMNDRDSVAIRKSLIAEGTFPPR
jgi:hypothetical protein